MGYLIAGTDYVLNAIQHGILSWLLCGHTAIIMGVETMAMERAVHIQNWLCRDSWSSGLICLEHGASLKLK